MCVMWPHISYKKIWKRSSLFPGGHMPMEKLEVLLLQEKERGKVTRGFHWVTLFCSMLFCHNSDKKKNWFCVEESLKPMFSKHVLPVFAQVFSEYSGLSPIPKMACLCGSSLSACGCGSGWPGDGRASYPEWALPCVLSCWERLPPPLSLNWNKWFGK